MTSFDIAAILKSLPFLMQGLGLSALLTAVAMLGGIALGLVIAVMRMSRVRALSWPAALYANGFRAIPLILVIFWFYFLVPLITGKAVGALSSVLVAFVLFEAAYYSEILRAGLKSVRAGQWQAATATGLAYFQALRLVILPQALRNMAPVMITQGVILFQDTSLVYVVSLHDLMTSATIVANTQNRLVEMYVFAALVYLIVCTTGGLLAKRLKQPGRG